MPEHVAREGAATFSVAPSSLCSASPLFFSPFSLHTFFWFGFSELPAAQRRNECMYICATFCYLSVLCIIFQLWECLVFLSIILSKDVSQSGCALGTH